MGWWHKGRTLRQIEPLQRMFHFVELSFMKENEKDPRSGGKHAIVYGSDVCCTKLALTRDGCYRYGNSSYYVRYTLGNLVTQAFIPRRPLWVVFS